MDRVVIPAKAGIFSILAYTIPAFVGMTLLLFALSACGLKGPLVRPADILQDEQQEDTQELNQDGTYGSF